MRALKALLALVLVLTAVGGGAYAAGHATRHHGQVPAAVPHVRPRPPVSASPTPVEASPAAPSPSTPVSSTPPPSSPPVAPVVVQVVMARGAHGADVRGLQQRLSQLAWLPETTTGRYDATTAAAVKGFQAKHGLPATGRLDRRTWHRLVALTATPSHDAMFNVLHPGPTLWGPGDQGRQVREVQARLAQLDWYFGDVTGSYDAHTVAAVKGFQAKRQIPVTGNVDQRTLDRLDTMTTTPTADALHNVVPSPGPLDARCLTGRVMCIDKTSSTLRWVVDGKVLQTMDVRFGSTLNHTPTREGLFHVFLKDADHVSTLFGSAMPFSMFFSGGEAVHYSSDFATFGYAGASHGCVNIRDYDGIRWLFSQVRVGDKVVVYWS
ncbi:L,D-transpeptidase family protein [Nocardioides cynanchi]|uniref:L,D-transpeptidase family protein n=1 Tax=Nocardioides cynanchi TaxID=2558918 RepID=UPI00177F5901|nr:L,D-transpeptidase family protein [Nocardioides cynanchi]